jgi:quercetin dioxygenase-like cupin family protein
MEITKKEKQELALKDFQKKIEDLENAMLASDDPNIVKGNSDTFPLKHSFTEGIYLREITLPKGSIAIGKLHKHENAWFLLSGELAIVTENGTEFYQAPYYAISPPGTKRVVYAVEDCIFVNVHPNPEEIKDIDTLEEKFVCNSYKDYEEYKLLKQ